MTMDVNARLALAAAAAIGLAACQQGEGAKGAGSNIAGSASATGTKGAPAAVAGGIDDPQAWVLTHYVEAEKARGGAPDAAVDVPNSQRPEYSPRLRALFAEDEKYADGEVGRLEFDFTTGAQDDDIRQVKLTSRDIDGAARKAVTADFVNFGKPVQIVYYFEKIGDSWFLDDVASPGYGGQDGSPPWALSLVLKYG